jgi:hypothetical protein
MKIEAKIAFNHRNGRDEELLKNRTVIGYANA